MTRATTFEQLRDETSFGSGTRLHLLAEIEKILKRRVISFFSSPSSWQGMISDDDADVITELLSAAASSHVGVSLIISSPGGFALGAERIVHACRQASSNDFHVIVPGQAKSAATIVCLGAMRIQMTATAELGPIDPQVPIKTGGDLRFMPAHVVVRSYETLMKTAEKSKGRIEPFLLQLDRYDARDIEDVRREVELSKKIAGSLLSSGMLKGQPKAKIDRCMKTFIDPDVTGSHGRPIFPDAAGQAGLTIDKIQSTEAVWRPLWEYYWRATWAVTNRHAKLLETPTSSLPFGSPAD